MITPLRWLHERRVRRDAQAYEALIEMRELAAHNPDVEVVLIQRVYQNARRGTKAVVHLDRSGEQRDAWFWWTRVIPGQMMAIPFSAGWGPHTNRDGVIYVGDENSRPVIYQLLSAREVARAGRHYKRHLKQSKGAA